MPRGKRKAKRAPQRRVRKLKRSAPATPPPPSRKPRQRKEGPHRPPAAIVGIGASAGGVEAFRLFLNALPADSGAGYVFILHMAPMHHSLLAEILQRETSMPVVEVEDEPRIAANHVYVMPPGRSMKVQEGRLRLGAHSADRQPRTIDLFLASLAEDQGPRAIGVILSGTATDGTLGLEAIKAAGGVTFAQDASAQQDGMPRSAASSGCVDLVLPPAEIAREIARIVAHPPGLQDAPPESVTHIDSILDVVRAQSGIDFSQYKSNTLHRRIHRRVVLRKLPGLGEYAAFLKENAHEVEALYQDILISVTSFFRDPEAFEALKEKVFPALFKNRSRQDPLRAWVLGCSSGEESYSVAIALKEYAEAIGSHVPMVVYATDLNNAAIEKSRAGLYSKDIARDVSPERLRRFFVETDGGYRVAKSIRDMCVFARQNVLSDPPFSRMDLISCRNVLIYMEPALQRKLLPILHYALKPGAYLFLGPSESVAGSRALFELEDSRHKLFRKTAAPVRLEQHFPLVPQGRPHEERGAPPPREAPAREERPPDVHREAERVLLARFAPAGVLVNAAGEVLQFRGDTGMYLAPAPGKASHELLKMAREGLLLPMRSALQKAKKGDVSVREEHVRVRSNGGFREIVLTVVPVKAANARERSFWVLFEPQPAGMSKAAARTVAAAGRRNAAEQEDRAVQVRRLEDELAATREYLQSVIEQQEATNEELQSANEEVQSANEELQSINEELETSKEEIQSSNEELTTVNEELHTRNTELNRANDDLNNLFGGMQMAIVMVWRDLRIRRFTPLAEKLFNLIASDVGRPIGNIKLELDVPDLTEVLTRVMETVQPYEREVRDLQGRWHLLRVRPYRTVEDKIDGAIIALVDIDVVKRNQETVARQAQLLEQAHDAMILRERSGEILYWNRGAERLYGFTRDEANGRSVQELLGVSAEDAARIAQSLGASSEWRGELGQRKRNGEALVVESAQRVFREAERELVLEANHDITERKQLESSLRARLDELAVADRNRNEFLAMLAHELRNPLAPLRNAVEILRSPERDAEETRKVHDLVDRQVAKMARLVDDLLDAARITRGQVQLQLAPVELAAVLQAAIETCRPQIESRHQELELVDQAGTVVLEADAVRLEQVFANLLNNASKYTPDRGHIRIEAELRREEGARPEAVVRVWDDGSGIAPEMLPRVFELFAQADRSLARSQGGLGIGLSLVRKLVELHGGRVTAASDGVGRGSVFTVCLPVAEKRRATPGGRGKQASRGDAPGPRRVLVVDDNPDIVESMSLLLTMQGHDVRTAMSGTDALEVAGAFRPQAAVLDIGMPGLDGYAVARKLRERWGSDPLLLVALSGYGSDEDVQRSRDAGFDAHFTKPVDFDLLAQMFRGHQSHPRRLKTRYGTKDDATINPSATQGPQGA